MRLDELGWITDEEKQRIDDVRAALAGKLPDGCPEDLVHDLAIARFLRGNDDNPQAAAEVCGRAVEYRHGLAASSPIKELRESLAEATVMDFSVLPHAQEVLPCLPVRVVEGGSAEGLPVLCLVPRLLDLERMEAVEDGALRLFVLGQLEQRWRVLHNLSLRQQRMVKFVELRDLNGASMTNLALRGSRTVSRFLSILSGLQDFYPEVIHQVLVLNTPSTFSTVFDMISPAMNPRMLSKIKVHPVGVEFTRIATMLSARAVWSWVAQSTSHLDFGSLVIDNGAQEYTARWLDEGQTASWSVLLKDGADVLFRRAFLSAPVAGKAAAPTSSEELVYLGKPVGGSFTPVAPGVLLLCLDNTSSWWSTKTCSITVS